MAKILVVDDDVRNLFALTTVFERYNINVITAESGKEAINLMNEMSDHEQEQLRHLVRYAAGLEDGVW